MLKTKKDIMYKVGDKVKIVNIFQKDILELEKTLNKIGVITLIQNNIYCVRFNDEMVWWYTGEEITNLRKEKLEKILCLK